MTPQTPVGRVDSTPARPTGLHEDDPRHGTDVGYSIGGCRKPCCADAHRRAQKERGLYRLQNGSCRIEADVVEDALRPWQNMGLGIHAISLAAGVCGDRMNEVGAVQRATFAAISALTEADFHDSSQVYADLTRTRINSLMAIGHRLDMMPIARKGGWRTSPRVTVATARAVRDYYVANESRIGPSPYTATRARKAGHLPPLAWDDPGTLAWPDGKQPRVNLGHRAVKTLDPVVVDRLLAGQSTPSTKEEKDEAMRRWRAMGKSEKSLCEIHGWKDSRYGRTAA